MTSLSALSCFQIAAQLESFSLAANRLNLTHGAISRAVRLLEDDLGTLLFERRNRRVFLTDAGLDLSKAVDSGFEQIEKAIVAIRARRLKPQITLSCEPTLLMRWLIPRIASFHADHPDIQLQLVAGGGPVKLGSGIDLAIRRNDFQWQPYFHAEHLFDEYVGPVCSPNNVFVATGQITRLHTKSRQDAWVNWEDLTGRTLTNDQSREFEHFYYSIQAAVAGLGVAIGPWHLVQDEIASGILTAPFGFTADNSNYQLLSSTPFVAGSHHNKLRDWLRSIAVKPHL